MRKSLELANFTQRTENILELNSPEIYYCRIHKYSAGHSTLCIQIYLEHQFEPILYLILEHTLYFSCPIQWLSANFVVNEQAKYLDVYSSLKPDHKNLKDFLLASKVRLPGALLTVSPSTPVLNISFVSYYATLTDNIEDWNI
jgi:hypothetical protein